MKKVLQSLVLLLGALMLPATANAQNVYGDTNNDGEVNIADVNSVIDVILGIGSSTSADVNDDGEINIADINVVIDIILGGHEQPEPDYVDLGLPSGTLWATRNVGANSSVDYGDYFAWGETEAKHSYSWDNYRWCKGSMNTLTKYCTNSSYGYYNFVDNKTLLDPEDDAAYVNWGPEWRIPTVEQQDELREHCTWLWTQKNGVSGELVTGPNGNTLFLPAAGYRLGPSLQNGGSEGWYWSRLLLTEAPYPHIACGLLFDVERADRGITLRNGGLTVRAVRVAQN